MEAGDGEGRNCRESGLWAPEPAGRHPTREALGSNSRGPEECRRRRARGEKVRCFPLADQVARAYCIRSHKWLPYLLPPLEEEEHVLRESGMLKSSSAAQSASIPSPPSSPAQPSSNHPSSLPSTPLRRLLDETADLIDSPPFTQILTLLLDTTFSHLTDHQIRTDAYKLPSPSSAIPRVQELPDLDLGLAKAKLANILAVLTRQAHAIGNGVPNRYAQAIEGVKELEAFAAVIYSSHFEFEALEDGGDGRARGTGEVRVEKGVVNAATGMLDSVWGRITGQ